MATLRDIKRKIRVVKNISQITQAMKMVAAAKLRRVQERVQRGKPYAQTMTELMGLLAPNVREFEHPLLQVRPVGAVGIIVVAADKGLCGSYNANLLRLAHQFIDQKTAEVPQGGDGRQPIRIITMGRKATEYFNKRGYPVVQSFPFIGVETPYEQVRAAANAITGMFLTGQVDELYLCYTEFVSPISQRPQSVKFLPIEPPNAQEGAATAGPKADFIFEPEGAELLGRLLPRFVESRLYQIFLESAASFFGAQMTAMTNATKNAKEQVDSLTLLANRTRQASITKELLDIVGGAEALKG